ncbi:MAG: TatD DNase family protein [Janthinobacterium sp.]|jgi:TatD DNase family protein
MWIDSHCHLDALGADAPAAAARAQEKGVSLIVIPAVAKHNFTLVAQLAASCAHGVYALGIHPMYVPEASVDDLALLRLQVEAALHLEQGDPRFIAIGEIGLDFFVPLLKTPELREKQAYFFREQLKIARDFDLPVLLHVRRSQDEVLKHVRQIRPSGGIAHAFNGSFQQAKAYLDLGFKLGFGGAMTFTRALQIRRLALELPLSALVLETDAPDMAPCWLHPAPNSPEQLPAIGAVLAGLRGIAEETVAQATTANLRSILPRVEMTLPVLAA